MLVHHCILLLSHIISQTKESFHLSGCRQKSKWVSQLGFTVPRADKIDEALLHALQEAMLHADHLVPSAVMIGSALLSVGAKQGGQLDDANEDGPSDGTTLAGKRLLLQTFEHHRSARAAIVENSIQQAASCTSADAKHHLGLISSLSKCHADKLNELLSKLAEGLEQIILLNPENAYGLLNALKPLLSRREICDRTWMLLRKAALYRHQGCRSAAIRGMLLLALQTYTSDSQSTLDAAAADEPCSSQAATTQQSRHSLYLTDALGFLRRFLNQQAPVRSVLYTSLKRTTIEDCKTAPYVCKILQQALSRSVQIDQLSSTKANIRLELCLIADNGEQILEPMDELLHACSLASYKEEESQLLESEDRGVSCTQDPAQHINLLREQLTALRDSCISDGAAALGLTDNTCTRQMQALALGCIEALLEDCVNEKGSTCIAGGPCCGIDNLVEHYISARDLVPAHERAEASHSHQNKGKGKKGSQRSHSKEKEKLEQRHCLMTPTSIALLIEYARCENTDEDRSTPAIVFAVQQAHRLSRDLQNEQNVESGGDFRRAVDRLAGVLLKACMDEIVSERYLLHPAANKSSSAGLKQIVDNDNWLIAGLTAVRSFVHWLHVNHGIGKAALSLRMASESYIEIEGAGDDDAAAMTFDWLLETLTQVMHRKEANFESQYLSALLRTSFALLPSSVSKKRADGLRRILVNSTCQSSHCLCTLLDLTLESLPPDDDLRLAERIAAAIDEVHDDPQADEALESQAHAQTLMAITHETRADAAKSMIGYLEASADDIQWSLGLPNRKAVSTPEIYLWMQKICNATQKLMEIQDPELEVAIAAKLFKFSTKCYQIVQQAAKQLVASKSSEQEKPPDRARDRPDVFHGFQW